jgi:hypothetical protein
MGKSQVAPNLCSLAASVVCDGRHSAIRVVQLMQINDEPGWMLGKALLYRHADVWQKLPVPSAAHRQDKHRP